MMLVVWLSHGCQVRATSGRILYSCKPRMRAYPIARSTSPTLPSYSPH